jgi:hypothetical protein
MTLRSTQPLKEINIRNISWRDSCRCVGLTTLLLSCANCLYIWDPQLPGTLWACRGTAITSNRTVCLYIYIYIYIHTHTHTHRILHSYLSQDGTSYVVMHTMYLEQMRALNIKNKVIRFYLFFVTLQNLKTK